MKYKNRARQKVKKEKSKSHYLQSRTLRQQPQKWNRRVLLGNFLIFWRGFGLFRSKFLYFPEATGDSIFAVAAEEFGFVGSVILIFLFLLFAWRGFYISSQSPDAFGKIFGSGIVILILTQSFLNIAAMSGLLPLTGVPLVFVSQGGSSLAVTLLEAGILLNISRTRA